MIHPRTYVWFHRSILWSLSWIFIRLVLWPQSCFHTYSFNLKTVKPIDPCKSLCKFFNFQATLLVMWTVSLSANHKLQWLDLLTCVVCFVLCDLKITSPSQFSCIIKSDPMIYTTLQEIKVITTLIIIMVENQLSSTSPPVWMKRKFKSLRKQMDGTTPKRAWCNFPSLGALLLWRHCHILRSTSSL